MNQTELKNQKLLRAKYVTKAIIHGSLAILKRYIGNIGEIDEPL